MRVDAWHGLSAGDQIGNLEYVVDDRVLAQYRRLVGSDGCFPSLMAEDCRAMLGQHTPEESLTTVWLNLQLLRPPIPGRRIQVGGWLKDVQERCGVKWLRASAFGVDEIGTEIMRSEAAFRIGDPGTQPVRIMAQAEGYPTPLPLACARAGDTGFVGKGRLWPSGRLGEYRAIANGMAGYELAPDGNGLTALAAGWLENLLGADFGGDFRWGGRLSIAFHRAVQPGTNLECNGVVIGHETGPTGVHTRRAILLVGDESGVRLATAEAIVKSPSPLLL